MNAMGACGLQLYNFGQTVSLVFFTDTWKPTSFYDRVKENWERGMHTLVLLDIKVREQSEENMARCVFLWLACLALCSVKLIFSDLLLDRGRLIYEPPRYMSPALAVSQLIETESIRGEGQPFSSLCTRSISLILPPLLMLRCSPPGRNLSDHSIPVGHGDPVLPLWYALPAGRANGGGLWRTVAQRGDCGQEGAPARGRVRRAVECGQEGEGQGGRVVQSGEGRAGG